MQRKPNCSKRAIGSTMRKLTEIGDEDSSLQTFRMLSKRVRSTEEYFSMARLQTAMITEMLIAMGFELTSTIPIVTSSGQFERPRMNEMSDNARSSDW
jgi:hypothetical protein